MELKIFAVKDIKAETFNTPMFLRSKGEAIRGFSDQVTNVKDSTISKYPEDFYLYELGTYNSDTGKMSVLDLPLALHCALDFKQ